jgi:plastocyanin
MHGARFIPVFLGMLVLATTVALKLGVGSSHAAVSSTMHAYVHEDNSIGITFDDGTAVGSQARTPPTIPPGTYTIRVIDDAVGHNIHLSGPGVDMATGVDTTASPTWTVTFQAGGTYRFQCDTHFDFMYGVFQTSGTASSSSSSSSSTSSSSSSPSSSRSTSTTSKPVASLRGTLAGTVGAAGKLTLALQGKPFSKLKAGRYKITVADKTPARSFVVKEKGHSAITVSGVSFVGTHSVTLNLTAGSWTFFTSAGATSTSSFSVIS